MGLCFNRRYDMKKTVKIIVSFLIVAAAVFASVLAFEHYNREKDKEEETLFVQSLKPTQFSSADDFVQTDFENIFFSKSQKKFFSFENGNLKEIAHTVYPVSTQLFGRNVSFELYLISQDGEFFGLGECSVADTKYYVKAMNVPPSANYSKTDCVLLLMSTQDGDQYYKFYSESLIYDLKQKKVRSRYIDDRYRPVTVDAVRRDDFAMLTTEMVKKATDKRTVFLSRAYYEYSNDPYRKTDINMIATGFTSASKIKDVVLNYAYDAEGGTFCFKRTETGFKSVIVNGSEEKTLVEFEGDYVKDYIRAGDFLVSVKDFTNGKITLTNALTGEQIKTDISTQGYIFNTVEKAYLSRDGRYVAVFGTISTEKGERQCVSFTDTKTLTVKSYAGEKLYDKGTQACFVGNNVIFSREGKTMMYEIK